MTAPQREIVAFLVFASFSILFSSAVQSSNDGKNAHATSRIQSFPLPKMKESQWETHAGRSTDIAKMTDDYEDVRRTRIDTDRLPNESDIDFFDQLKLFNSTSTSSTKSFPNRTIIRYAPSNGTETQYTVHHLATFLGFQSNSATSTVVSTNAIRRIASALMAVRDFNAGDNTIVSQIRPSHCDGKLNLSFTMEIINTAIQPLVAATELTKILKRARERQQPAGSSNGNVVPMYPSGIIGAERSLVSSSLSILAGVNDLVTISYASSSDKFSSKVQYPLFGRTIPPTSDDAAVAISFFREVLNATHLGVLHINEPYGNSYANSIRNAASAVNITTRRVTLPLGVSREDANRALARLKGTGIRYFMAILLDKEFNTVMPLAYEMGIAGEKHFWMFAEIQMELMNSIGDGFDIPRAAHGSAILATSVGKDLLGGSHFYDAYSSHFSTLWTSEKGLDYLQSKLPQLNLTTALIEGSEPSVYELFMYEAVVALCLASCDAAAKAYPSIFTSDALYESFTKTTFDGLYGPVSFDHKTGDRSVDTVNYAVYNILATEGNSKVEAKYQRVIKRGGSAKGSWESLPNTEFIYADGTHIPPDNLPPAKKDKKLVSVGVVAVCLSICAVLLLLSVICSIWSYRGRNTKVVRASQPFFLYMLCAGTFISTLAVIPMSLLAFDISRESKSAACISIHWLYNFGFVISFSAMFTKTKRIYMIMEMSKKHKRVLIKPIHVMKPFFVIISLNVSLLIALTVAAPPKYSRYTLSPLVDQFGRTTSSVWLCAPDENSSLTYDILRGILTLINDVVVLLSAYCAYRSRRISTEYNESHYLASTVYIQLQIHLILLISYIPNISPTASFCITFLAVLVSSFSILSLMFLPKMIGMRDEKKKQLEKEKRKKERLERLQRFDALKKENEDDTEFSVERVTKAAVMETKSELNDEFVETPRYDDNDYGVEILSFSMKEQQEKMLFALSEAKRENQRLKNSIHSMKGSIKSSLLSSKKMNGKDDTIKGVSLLAGNMKTGHE